MSIDRFRVTDQNAIDVHPHGEWVRFEDYDRLRAQLAERERIEGVKISRAALLALGRGASIRRAGGLDPSVVEPSESLACKCQEPYIRFRQCVNCGKYANRVTDQSEWEAEAAKEPRPQALVSCADCGRTAAPQTQARLLCSGCGSERIQEADHV